MLKDQKEVKIFLKKITKGLWNYRLKKEIQQEFLCHIEDKMSAMESTNSLDKVLADLGDPSLINKQLKEQHILSINKYSISMLMILISLSFIVFGVQFYYVFCYKFAKNSVVVKNEDFDRFMHNQKLLKKYDFFVRSEMKSNAGAYLDHYFFSTESPLLSRQKTLSDDLIAELISDNFWSYQNFGDIVLKPEYIEIDLSWFENLQKFDHWIVSHSSDGTLNVLDSNLVIAYVRLYLAHGFANNNLEFRLNNVRKFSELVYSQSLISSNFLALKLLKEEALFLEKAKKSNIDISWNLIPKDIREIAKFNHWTSNRLIDFTSDPSILNLLLSESTVNICSGGFEAISRFENNSFIKHKVFDKSMYHKQINFFSNVFIPRLNQICDFKMGQSRYVKDNSPVLAVLEKVPFIEYIVALNYLD